MQNFFSCINHLIYQFHNHSCYMSFHLTHSNVSIQFRYSICSMDRLNWMFSLLPLQINHKTHWAINNLLLVSCYRLCLCLQFAKCSWNLWQYVDGDNSIYFFLTYWLNLQLCWKWCYVRKFNVLKISSMVGFLVEKWLKSCGFISSKVVFGLFGI